ncbi:unnamed protein product [Calypogeia fissa]
MDEEASLEERAYQLEQLEEEREHVDRRLKNQQNLNKKYHDKKVQVVHLQPGDLVLMYDSQFAHFPGKLHTRWLGPYIVKNFFQNGSVEVATLGGEVYPVRIHYDSLKKYFQQED